MTSGMAGNTKDDIVAMSRWYNRCMYKVLLVFLVSFFSCWSRWRYCRIQSNQFGTFICKLSHVTNWSCEQLIMWPTDRVTNWSCDQLIMWAADYVTNWLCDQLIMWPTDHVTNWSCDQLSMWPTEHVTNWSCDHLIMWPTDHETNWSSDQLIMWPTDPVTQGSSSVHHTLYCGHVEILLYITAIKCYIMPVIEFLNHVCCRLYMKNPNAIILCIQGTVKTVCCSYCRSLNIDSGFTVVSSHWNNLSSTEFVMLLHRWLHRCRA